MEGRPGHAIADLEQSQGELLLPIDVSDVAVAADARINAVGHLPLACEVGGLHERHR